MGESEHFFRMFTRSVVTFWRFWKKDVTRCVTLMGNSNPAGSSTRALFQLPSTAAVRMKGNLRADFPLLRLIKLHQGYNPAARNGSTEASEE